MHERNNLNNHKILEKVRAGSKNIQFSEMVKLIEGFSFRLARINGSHHIFNHPDLPELVNIQNRKGKVVPYQVNQFLSLVEKYDLRLED